MRALQYPFSSSFFLSELAPVQSGYEWHIEKKKIEKKKKKLNAFWSLLA